ncbi:MAG TPA: TetR/AcrR family transcriptional regulator [Chloroflexota bacterium]|nr:TetR/AcrR family transcriptional regulator [Chloroflexota bacterium]
MPRTSAATKQQRRAHIMQAALRCFARAGFYATTMDDVAVQAGVSKGTPYLYFSSKAELYCALYEWWSCGLSDRVNAAIDALPEEARLSPRRTLLAVLSAIGEHVAEEPDACRVLLEAMGQARHVPGIAEATSAFQAETLAALEHLLESGVSAGDWRLEGGAALHARLLLAAIYGLMTQWHVEPGSFSWSEAASGIVAQLSSTRAS